jgi:hypothetical protein
MYVVLLTAVVHAEVAADATDDDRPVLTRYAAEVHPVPAGTVLQPRMVS